jgi:hypothetical protein
VGTAFLKGFSFEKLMEALRAKGIHSRIRRVFVQPPMNVWRHLRKLSTNLKVKAGDELLWVLEALKPVYGLGDGPLAWQLCLLEFLIDDKHGTQSHFDENFIIWFSDYITDTDPGVQALATSHVDDNNMASD